MILKIFQQSFIQTFKSEIFYENETQKKDAEEIVKNQNIKFEGKIETNISKIKNYCKAEDYHQKYIEKTS